MGANLPQGILIILMASVADGFPAPARLFVPGVRGGRRIAGLGGPEDCPRIRL